MSSMNLPRAGQEYARITFTRLPADATVQASIDGGTTWVATEAGATGQERRLLVRGPLSTRTTGLLVTGRVNVLVRVVDDPEDVIRDAGEIGLV